MFFYIWEALFSFDFLNFIFDKCAIHRRIEIDEERLMLAFETLDSTGSGVRTTIRGNSSTEYFIHTSGYLDAACIRRALGGDMSDEEIEKMVRKWRRAYQHYFLLNIIFSNKRVILSTDGRS